MTRTTDAFDTLRRESSAANATPLSIIIPASNEAAWIGTALEALLASDMAPAGDPAREIVVVANGCRDDTVGAAGAHTTAAAARGWRLTVLDVAEGNKLNALNVGDAAATGPIRLYVDADVRVDPGLVAALHAALDRPEPTYASGRPVSTPSGSWVTRAYTRVWKRTPFATTGVAGYGVFAVNATGRARWGAFPRIVADDTFVRLNFAPAERIGVPASYQLPVPEGFSQLVRLRRRQDYGAREVTRLHPDLARNDDKPPFGAGRALAILVTDPVGFAVYAAVALTARATARRHAGVWARAR